jgi:hypothetical protein
LADRSDGRCQLNRRRTDSGLTVIA